MNARTTALSALIATRRSGAWSDGALKEYILRDRLDARDAAFASRLCYGVLQNRLLLDFYIAHFLNGKLRDLQPVVLDILRLGAFQIVFLNKVPVSAAVNEAVEQCKAYANRRAAGLVNGVLRALARSREALPQPPDLATRYSHPQELVELLRESVGGDQIEALLKADNEIAPTVLHANPLKADAEAVFSELSEQGVALMPHPWLPGCRFAQGTGNLERLDAFRDGRVYVQDPAAHLASLASGVQPGMTVLDMCAAPGGKSFAAAMQMENRGEILSCDIHPHKLALIEKGAERLGISIIRTALQNGTERCELYLDKMDAVIADVPCSGLGVIRKKPDIRYKALEPLQRLPEIQRAILENAGAYVRPGGTLIYSTCTVLRRENEAVAEDFLRAHPEFTPEAIPVPENSGLENDGMLTLLPNIHGTDGFFICKMRKHL